MFFGLKAKKSFSHSLFQVLWSIFFFFLNKNLLKCSLYLAFYLAYWYLSFFLSETQDDTHSLLLAHLCRFGSIITFTLYISISLTFTLTSSEFYVCPLGNLTPWPSCIWDLKRCWPCPPLPPPLLVPHLPHRSTQQNGSALYLDLMMIVGALACIASSFCDLQWSVSSVGRWHWRSDTHRWPCGLLWPRNHSPWPFGPTHNFDSTSCLWFCNDLKQMARLDDVQRISL